MSALEVKKHLLTLVGERGNECDVVAKSSGLQLSHISLDDNIKEFGPYITKRSVDGEDRIVPRISCGVSLISCMDGYLNLISEYLEKRTDPKWDSSFTIYGFDYVHAVRPCKALLPTVNATNEHWITNHNEYHRVIKPLKLGKFYILNLTLDRFKSQITLLLDVKSELVVSEGNRLSPGLYRVHFSATSPRTTETKVTDIDRFRLMYIHDLNKAHAESLINSVASLESVSFPPHHSWMIK